MNPDDTRAEFVRQSERFGKLCPLDADPLVVFLKAHLLIEEELFEIVKAGIADARPLEGAHLTFSQTLRVAKAASGRFFNDLEGEAIGRINKVRNSLAHSSEADIQVLLADLIAWAQTHPRFRSLNDYPTTVLKMRAFVGARWGYLTGVRDALRVVRETLPSPTTAP